MRERCADRATAHLMLSGFNSQVSMWASDRILSVEPEASEDNANILKRSHQIKYATKHQPQWLSLHHATLSEDARR